MSDSDLPAGYRWATEDEAEANLPYAIVVKRTADSNGRPYTQDEADVAVPQWWWHCFGGVGTEGDMAGLWMQVMAGPTEVPPEGANQTGTAVQEIFKVSNPYLKYLGSFNHEPSDLEKDKLAPDDFRTWDDEGNLIPWEDE